MATEDKKITQLDPLTLAASGDLFAIVDISEADVSIRTKRITAQNLFASPQPIGSTTASTGSFTTGSFTTLDLPTGATIDEFSTDGTLAGDSDTAVPTEKAVKTYVDAAISSVSTSSISAGDSSVAVIDSTSTGIINVTVDSSLVSTFTTSGLQLSSGTRVNEFSTDGTLSGNSDNAIPTEKAVKTYVDNSIASGLNVQTVYTDSTAVNGDALLVDTTGGAVSIELQPSNDSKIIIKKTTSDGNPVTITVAGGLIDNIASKTISVYLEAVTCISDGTNYYVT